MSELDKFLEAFEGRLLKAYQNCPATASPYEVLRLVRMAVSDARQDVQRTAGTEGSANG